MPANRLRVLEKWAGNSDGGAGKRVRDAIIAEINKSYNNIQ